MVFMKKRSIMLVALMIIVAMFVAACGGNNVAPATPAPTTEGGTTTPPAVEEKAVPAEITAWFFPQFNALDGEVGKYENSIITAFNEKHPEIKVNVEMLTWDGGPEKINVAIATNTAPDVIYDAPGRIIDWAKKGLLVNLNDIFTKEIQDDITPSLLIQSMIGNDTYMFPLNTGPFTMAVNKKIFEDIGALDLLPLDRPDRTWTVAEFETALRAVKEKAPGIIPAGFYAKSTAGDQGTRGFLTNLGASRFLNEDNSAVAINSESGVAGLQWVVDAYNDGLLAPGAASMAAGDHNDLFLQGKSAFAINYSAVLKTIFSNDKADGVDDVLLPYPTPDGSAPKLEPFISGFAVFNNNDAVKEAASKKLVDFMVNDPEWGINNVLQTGGLSVRNSVTGLYDGSPSASEYEYSELARKFLTDPPTIADGYAEIRTYWFPALQKAILGAATPQEALDEFAEKANGAISAAKAAN